MLNRTDLADGGAMRANGHITRRHVLTRLASAGALAVGTGAPTGASTDPIFAAIERHRAAWRASGDLCRAIDEVAAAHRGQRVGQADWDAFERASANAEQALEELLATPPAIPRRHKGGDHLHPRFRRRLYCRPRQTLPDDAPKIPDPCRLRMAQTDNVCGLPTSRRDGYPKRPHDVKHSGQSSAPSGWTSATWLTSNACASS